jgi:hypothetical protein
LSHTFKSLHIENPEIRELFARLEKALNEAQPEYKFYKRNAEPIRYGDGDLVYADGTNWNPGSGEGLYHRAGGAWNFIEGSGGGGVGTVTLVSVVSANGFAGTVATASTTPAITLTTTITGILKGNGTALSAAVAGDFPTLNQNTTGSAASLTTARTIDGQSFNGTSNITVVAPGTVAAANKATPADADLFPLVDSAASNVLKNISWADVVGNLFGSETWTPVVTFATPGDVSLTYTRQLGWLYWKYSEITLHFDIEATITHTTASGELWVTGATYGAASTPTGATYAGVLGDFRGITKANFTQFNPILSVGGSTVRFRASASAQAPATLTATEVPTGGTLLLRGSITYTS